MDENAPEVTVLLPVRNGAATLDEAVQSILAQRFSSFELLIVDDGSTDATPSLLAQFAAVDPRVRVLRQSALGLVAALNRGLAEARGELIARMDADDIAAPGRLERQVNALAETRQAALVGSGWRVFGPDGSTRRVVVPPTTDAGLRAAMATANALAHPSVMMRRDAALRVGGYRTAFLHAEDYDLWLRLMDRYQLTAVPDVLLDYREHAGQSTWRGLEQRILSEMAALASHDRRQAGRPDLGKDPAPIDRDRLLRMGLTEAEIEAGIIARALGAAKDAQAAGQFAAVRAAAALGLRQGGLSGRTRLHLRLMWLAGRFGRRARAPVDA